MTRARRWPIAPVALLLFPVASVLGYMSQNLSETTLGAVLPVLEGALAFAVAVWLIVVGLRRRADAVAAIIACVWVVSSLYYLSLFGGINTWIGGNYTLMAMLPIAVVALLAVSYAVHRLPGLDAPIHLVLVVVAAVMAATPLWMIVSYELRNGEARAVYDADTAAAAAEMASFAPSPAAAADAAQRPPDIYHFIFDRYGSAETLATAFGIEATIGDALRMRGFYVAEGSHSNYLKTGQSLASTFYMDYLDLLADDPRIDGASWHPVFAMLDDHRVARFLQDRGYDFVQFGSWWRGTHENPRADENHPYGFSEFAMYYLRQTALRAAIGLLPENRLTQLIDWDNGQCQRIARQLERIKAIGEREAPLYVFVHFLLPHDPYVFKPDGSCLTNGENIARGAHQGYIDQVAYADRIIEDVVGALQDHAAQPVILVQADEGPYPDRDYAIPWQKAPAEELRIKTGILNAYYFPDGDYRGLYSDITPVNTYRLLFNRYFGASYPLLPDRIYAFPDDKNLYAFHDVTDRIRGGAAREAADAIGSGAGVPVDLGPIR